MLKNSSIFYFVLFASTIYVLFEIVWELLKISRKHKNQFSLYDEMIKAIEEQKVAKKKLISNVENLFGFEVAEQVEKGNIWERMPKYLLEIALGEPQKEEIFSKDGKKYSKWYYFIHSNQNMDLHYSLQIILDDKGVVSWEEINKDIKKLDY